MSSEGSKDRSDWHRVVICNLLCLSVSLRMIFFISLSLTFASSLLSQEAHILWWFFPLSILAVTGQDHFPQWFCSESDLVDLRYLLLGDHWVYKKENLCLGGKETVNRDTIWKPQSSSFCFVPSPISIIISLFLCGSPFAFYSIVPNNI